MSVPEVGEVSADVDSLISLSMSPISSRLQRLSCGAEKDLVEREVLRAFNGERDDFCDVLGGDGHGPPARRDRPRSAR